MTRRATEIARVRRVGNSYVVSVTKLIRTLGLQEGETVQVTLERTDE